MEWGPQGAGFLFGAQSGVSTGEGALGLVSLSKHRKKEPSKGQKLLDPGAWRLGRARGSCGGLGREGNWVVFLHFFLFLLLFLLAHPCFLALDHFCTKASKPF